MKYTIDIPTIESLETLTTTAHREAQRWMLENISAEMENQAYLGFESFLLDVCDCPYNADEFDTNEVQNVLREMGYSTTYYPRKRELLIEWSNKARSELQAIKDNGIVWKFTTREQAAKRRAELRAKYGI